MGGEDLDFVAGCVGELHPWVLQDLLWCQPLSGVSFENLFEELEGAFAHVTWGAPTALDIDDLLLQLAHVSGLERHRSEEHRVEHDASAPDVRLEASVALASEDLWGDVGWCSALLRLQLVLVLDELADSEVADLDVALRGQEDVVQLDVSVEHLLLVDVH